MHLIQKDADNFIHDFLHDFLVPTQRGLPFLEARHGLRSQPKQGLGHSRRRRHSCQEGEGRAVAIEVVCLSRKSAVKETMAHHDDAMPVPIGPKASAYERLALAGMRVLLVDDSPDNLHLASYILTKAGASVVTAESGYQAIALAMIKTFDVVLMDLEMPDMDGFETAVTLMELNPRLPVIALTAHALPEYRRRATDLGFRAFLPKPLLPHALLKSLGDLSLRAPASY